MQRRSFLTWAISLVSLSTTTGSSIPTRKLPTSKSSGRDCVQTVAFGSTQSDCEPILMSRSLYEKFIEVMPDFAAAFAKEFPGCLTPNSTATISTTSPQPTSTVEPPTSIKP